MKTFFIILFVFLPSLAWADHTETHSLIQINQELIDTFSGVEMVDILIVLFFVAGLMSGQRQKNIFYNIVSFYGFHASEI